MPFHTPVKLVDAEDIENDRIRTHDRTLKVNNLATQSQSQNIKQPQNEYFIFTQSRDPNDKTKPAFKKIARTVIQQIILFIHASKNTEMMMIKKKHMQDQKRHKNLLYNIFAPSPITKQKQIHRSNDLLIKRVLQLTSIVVEVNHKLSNITKKILHRIEIALHLEIDIIMTEVLLFNIIPALDHLSDVVRAINIDHVHFQEKIPIQGNFFF